MSGFSSVLSRAERDGEGTSGDRSDFARLVERYAVSLRSSKHLAALLACIWNLKTFRVPVCVAVTRMVNQTLCSAESVTHAAFTQVCSPQKNAFFYAGAKLLVLSLGINQVMSFKVLQVLPLGFMLVHPPVVCIFGRSLEIQNRSQTS